MSDQPTSPSYMELRLDFDGKAPLFLRVPTFWDAVGERWIGFIKTPVTMRIIAGEGKNSFDLQNSFNINIEKMFRSDLADEVFGMFQPRSYWDEQQVER